VELDVVKVVVLAERDVVVRGIVGNEGDAGEELVGQVGEVDANVTSTRDGHVRVFHRKARGRGVECRVRSVE